MKHAITPIHSYYVEECEVSAGPIIGEDMCEFEKTYFKTDFGRIGSYK